MPVMPADDTFENFLQRNRSELSHIIEDHRQRFGYAFYFVNIKYLYFCFVFAFIEQDQTTFFTPPR